ncbi:MAG: hypothetical protein PHI50_01625 [Alphaproteobacteria bacterium]|nr:hypothetical protein [Alphaproteobacteria bacterium]
MQENIMTSPVEEMQKPVKAKKRSHLKTKAMIIFITIANLAAVFSGCDMSRPNTQDLNEAKAKENGITRELPPEDQIAPEDVIEEPDTAPIEGVSKAEDAFRFHVQNAYYNSYLLELELLKTGGERNEETKRLAGARGQSWDYIYTAFENRGVDKNTLEEWLDEADQGQTVSRQEAVKNISAIWQEKDMDSKKVKEGVFNTYDTAIEAYQANQGR